MAYLWIVIGAVVGANGRSCTGGPLPIMVVSRNSRFPKKST